MRKSIMLGGIIAAFALAITGSSAKADPDKSAKQPAMPKEFETLKKLVGNWEGKTKMGDKEMPVAISYELTANGSAILERLFPGTPHEMISVYTAEDNKVSMTHYCALGNHPKMTLKKADDKSVAFEMASNDGLRAPGEMHMHAMNVSWTDADHIKEEWTSFENGAKKEGKVFELTRKKS